MGNGKREVGSAKQEEGGRGVCQRTPNRVPSLIDMYSDAGSISI